jgi:hypothetical protein
MGTEARVWFSGAPFLARFIMKGGEVTLSGNAGQKHFGGVGTLTMWLCPHPHGLLK